MFRVRTTAELLEEIRTPLPEPDYVTETVAALEAAAAAHKVGDPIGAAIAMDLYQHFADLQVGAPAA